MKPYGQSIPDLVSTLSKQRQSSPIVELIEAMYKDGASLFIEVGPRNILGYKVHLTKEDAHVVSLDRPANQISSAC